VHAGEIFATGAQLELVFEALATSTPLRVRDWKGDKILTRQEDRIVQLVANGLTNREIAAELRLSEHTVKNYLFRIFEKLGVSSRVELVLFAMSKRSDAAGTDKWSPYPEELAS
jgi:DNA-binding NarL/FixJ family response regulator